MRAPVTRTATVLSVLHTAPPRDIVRTTSGQAGGNVPQQLEQPLQQLDQPRPQLDQSLPVLLCWGTPHLQAVTRHSLMMEIFRAGVIRTAPVLALVYITSAIFGFLVEAVEAARTEVATTTVTLLPLLYPTPGQIIIDKFSQYGSITAN